MYAQDEGRERNLYVVPYEGGNPRLIGPTRTDRVTPRWAPDNRRLAFASPDSSAGGILIADLPERRFVTRGRSALRLFVGGLAWSPDGRKLLFPPDDPGRFVLLDLETDRETSFSPPSAGCSIARCSRRMAGKSFSALATVTPRSLATGPGDKPLAGAYRSPGGFPLLWAADGWIYLMRGRELWRVRPKWRRSALRIAAAGVLVVGAADDGRSGDAAGLYRQGD